MPSKAHESLYREAMERGEATWQMLLGKLGKASRLHGADRRARAAEVRAFVLLAMLMNIDHLRTGPAHERPEKSKRVEKPARPGRRRRSRWAEREDALRDLERALHTYLRLIPPGAIHEGRLWFVEARMGAERMLGFIKTETEWRSDVLRDPKLLGPALEALWTPGTRGGRPPSQRVVVLKASEFGLGPEDVAYLESVARLAIEDLRYFDRSSLLPAWKATAQNDSLYLAPSKGAAHDAVLRDKAILTRWDANFRNARAAPRKKARTSAP